MIILPSISSGIISNFKKTNQGGGELPITTSRAFNSSGDQVGSTNTGDIPDNWVTAQSVASVIFANDGSVTTIGSGAFLYNQLTAVTIPNSVTTIGARAFQNNALTSVTIPNSVTSIGTYAFYSNLLTSVTIPNSVTSIGDDVFYNNPLESVNIDMTNIPSIFYSDGLTFSLTIGPNVRTIGDFAFMFNNLTSVTIPNGVTSIGSYAFSYCSLASVSIDNSVASIGSYAFKTNPLASINCFAPATAFVGSQALSYTANPLVIHVPATGAVSDSWTAGPQSFQGNDNVTVIKDL